MQGDCYLLDNNALTKLTTPERRNPLVRDRCMLIDEVHYEARFRSRPDLDPHVLPVTPDVLGWLVKVMAHPDSEVLIDLYHCQGNADPLLIASALALTEQSKTTLFSTTYIIVTDDERLTSQAKSFNIATTTSAEFRARLAD